MSIEASLLLQASAAKTRVPATKTRLGNRSLKLEGMSDGAEGVQWNAWVEWPRDRQMAYAGVNLEGKEYNGWPVARFIERELQASRLGAQVDGPGQLAGADTRSDVDVFIGWAQDPASSSVCD